jgi:dolichyl-phosphate beta-glucosyltransferase
VFVALDERPDLSLILPAYNEASRLSESIGRVGSYIARSPHATEVILVDDGSTDDSRALAEALAQTRPWLRVVGHSRNRGKGAAVRYGVETARATELIAFLDADLTIPVDLLDELADRVRGGRADIAIASRFVPGSVVRRPLARQVMGYGFRAFVRVLVPTGVEDTQCGGKVYRAALARELFAQQRLNGFSFDAEVLYIARRRGTQIVEVPFALVQNHDTSLHLMKDALRMLGDLLVIRVNAALGRYCP